MNELLLYKMSKMLNHVRCGHKRTLSFLAVRIHPLWQNQILSFFFFNMIQHEKPGAMAFSWRSFWDMLFQPLELKQRFIHDSSIWIDIGELLATFKPCIFSESQFEKTSPLERPSLVAQWWRIHHQCRRCRQHSFNPWVRKILWRREW